jgi:hypothetical protein
LLRCNKERAPTCPGSVAFLFDADSRHVFEGAQRAASSCVMLDIVK